MMHFAGRDAGLLYTSLLKICCLIYCKTNSLLSETDMKEIMERLSFQGDRSLAGEKRGSVLHPILWFPLSAPSKNLESGRRGIPTC